MIVCVCHRVSDREITRQAQAGMGFRDIQRNLGVATCCGKCATAARVVVNQATTGHSAPAACLTLPGLHVVPSPSHG